METINDKAVKNPTPEERPDLYDDYDYTDRPEGYQTGIKTPDYIQKIIDDRAAKKLTKNGQTD